MVTLVDFWSGTMSRLLVVTSVCNIVSHAQQGISLICSLIDLGLCLCSEFDLALWRLLVVSLLGNFLLQAILRLRHQLREDSLFRNRLEMRWRQQLQC